MSTIMALDNPTLQKAVTTADKVFDAMLHAIVNGKIAAGSKSVSLNWLNNMKSAVQHFVKHLIV